MDLVCVSEGRQYGAAGRNEPGGNDDQVKKAKDTLRNALIGLLIVSLSYAIVTFFIGSIIDTSSQGRSGCSPEQAQIDPTCAPNPLGSVTID